MPSIDVTEVLTSREFCETFQVIRSSAVVGSDGVMVITQSKPINVVGVIIPGNGSTLRMADGTRVQSFIDVYTQFRLTQSYKTSDAASVPSDIIIWHDWQFTVKSISDFTGYGSGFVHASCDFLQLNPPD